MSGRFRQCGTCGDPVPDDPKAGETPCPRCERMKAGPYAELVKYFFDVLSQHTRMRRG